MRTYAMAALRVFVLEDRARAAAARFLASLVDGDAGRARARPRRPRGRRSRTTASTSASPTRPGGAAACRRRRSTVSRRVQAGRRRRGPSRVGDTGASAPEHWKGGLARATSTCWCSCSRRRRRSCEQMSARAARRSSPLDAFTESRCTTATRCRGTSRTSATATASHSRRSTAACRRSLPDVLPKAPAGEFLFGHPSQYADFTYPVPQPAAQLGHNGSFVAFRILAQDCDGFETVPRGRGPADRPRPRARRREAVRPLA